MNRTGKLITLASLAVAAAIAIQGCGKQQQAQQQAVPVDVYTVKTMNVPVTSRLTGRANPVKQAEVRPQVNGVILKRLFVEGSVVQQGHMAISAPRWVFIPMPMGKALLRSDIIQSRAQQS